MEILGRSQTLSKAKKIGKKASGFLLPVAAYQIQGAAKKKTKFLPGLKKVLPAIKKSVRAVGKVTSPITTAAARAFLPKSLVDAAAKLDPTKKGTVQQKAAAAVQSLTRAVQEEKELSLPDERKDALIKTLTNPKVLGIIAGGAVILFVMSKKRRK